jgi:hypothetical protein
MPTTRQTYDAVLKEFYLPKVREVLNNTMFMLSIVQTNSEDIEGRRAVLSIRTARNSGVGSRTEMGTLPVAGNQGYSEERVPLKYHYGRILISGPVMRSTSSDRGSFTRALTSETEGVTNDLKNDINRQIFGTSDGKIATLTAAASSTTVTVLAPANPTTMRQLQPGMSVDIGAVGATTPTTVTIVSVNATAGTFVVSAAVTVSAGDIVSRAGAANGTTPAGQKELTGLQTQIAATGALWNIDPATVGDVWASSVYDNGNAAPTEGMYLQAAMDVGLKSGSEIDLWVTDAGTHRKTAALLTTLKRFPGTVVKGGYSLLDMSNPGQGDKGDQTVVLRYEKDCPAGVAFGITTNRFQWYKMSDWEFMQEDGAVLARIVGAQGQDAYEGTLFCYAELATDGRNSHARINNILYT